MSRCTLLVVTRRQNWHVVGLIGSRTQICGHQIMCEGKYRYFPHCDNVLLYAFTDEFMICLREWQNRQEYMGCGDVIISAISMVVVLEIIVIKYN